MLTVFLLSLCCFCCFTTTTNSQQAQRDYLKLPLLHTTRFPSLTQALAFDSLRLSSLYSSNSTPSAPLVSGAAEGAGQYYVDFPIGTPPQRLRLVADTGSDLVWARCSPCRGGSPCSRLHPPGSAFLPRRSASFSPFHCYNPACRLLPSAALASCPRTRLHSPCRYRYSYADRSFSAGFFSRETLILNATSGRRYLRLPGFQFGCAFNVSAGPSLRGARGVLGLGRGSISFPSQAARHLLVADRFSYCLMDYNLSPPPTSYLLIGAKPLSNVSDLRYTPLQSNPLSPTFYYIRILGASIDGSGLPIDSAVWALDRNSGTGGTIIDSGTTLTFLPAPAYHQILKAMLRRLRRDTVVAGPPGFDLCVNTSSELRLPRLGFRLLGGAELAPPPGNYFVDAAEGVRCLALQAVSPAGGAGFGVIGNLMQQGFLFVFDREADMVGFSRTGCAVD